MNEQDFWDEALPWIWPTAALIAWLTLGLLGGGRLVHYLTKRAEGTANIYDDLLTPRLRRPLQLGVIVVGLYVWAQFAPVHDKVRGAIDVLSKAGLIIIIVMAVDAVIQTWMQVRSQSSRVLATSGGVLRTSAKVVVFIIGSLMVLTAVGIDVTPLVASLGVGSLAVGLALQKTLEDFVAGLLLAADQPVRVGDFVEVDGLSGTVLQIGWRSSRLETRERSHVIVPNSVLAQSKLINRSRPEEQVEFIIEVGVHYDSDLDQVVRVCVEVATEIHERDPRAAPGYVPRANMARFGDSSLDFVVWCSARRFLDHFGLKDRVMRALRTRFAAEGINIPYPIRTLDVPSDSPLTRPRIGRAEEASE
ncbi:MAG: hypothetical protein CVU56_22290 [Deltaproteobacteria bacterium HGW-Deltaproteobacteria-14]|jgi:small-conductance mechanosensitive channel|nr:MAG: hypothetical protein CVU56_22290 [Deltaproteobacteria bacterium HGW-Deltaproteobacteria-14]